MNKGESGFCLGEFHREIWAYPEVCSSSICVVTSVFVAFIVVFLSKIIGSSRSHRRWGARTFGSKVIAVQMWI